MPMNAYNFWKNFDNAKDGREIKEICKAANITYQRIADQRSDCRFPRLEDAYALASTLNISLDYLMSGKRGQHQGYSDRALRVAAAFDKAPDIDKDYIEQRILDIVPPGKNNQIPKSE